MKMLLLVALLVPMLSHGQQKSEPTTVDKKVVCTTVEDLSNALNNNSFAELPVWIGKDDTSSWALIANKSTGTWTLIQFNDKVGCVIGSGDSQVDVTKYPD
jgi:hypothetical protein